METEKDMSAAAADQLCVLDNTQSLIRTIFLGLAMQYNALSVQRTALLTQEPPCTDPKKIQIAASVIILYALFGFQKQAEELACAGQDSCGCADFTDAKLNATVLLVALIRLFRLSSSASAQETEELETML